MSNSRSTLVGFAFAVTLCGCAHDPAHVIGAPVLDTRFGEAVTRARAMQIINPEGVQVNDQGHSGKAAHSAIERYDGRPGQTSSSNSDQSRQAASTPAANGAAQP
jgi:hypothetical protein